METAGKFNIQLADGTCGRHIAGYCVWKGYCELGFLFIQSQKELSETQQLQESLNTSRRKGGEAASEESAKLRILYTASQDTSKSMRERNKAVDELQKCIRIISVN